MQFLKTDTSKSYGWILMTFSGNDLNGTRNKGIRFWDPGCQIFLGWILMIYLGYLRNGITNKF